MVATVRPSERARQGAARRRQAAEAEEDYRQAMYASRPDLAATSGKIKAPPDKERVAERFGGGYRRRARGEYDWFDELNPEEQQRLRQNWFTSSTGRGLAPDEVEDAGLSMDEWLAYTRGIDAAKAVKAGREPSLKRYGGRDPMRGLHRASVEGGSPEEHGTRVERFEGRRRPNGHREIDRSDRVQFFTDENGVVHPIRATYENREPRSKYVDEYDEDF